MTYEILYLALLTFGVAMLYSSVGHGGASGYLAVMGLIGMHSTQMRPTALVLNLLVAGVGSYRYIRAGCFKWRAFWPFALTSIPFAFVGGVHQLPEAIYRKALGLALIAAGLGMLFRIQRQEEPKPVPLSMGLGIGVLVGYVSGLVGVGGGIFLSPILILARWATTKQTLGIASLFIFVNSLAALIGQFRTVDALPTEAWFVAPAALAGGLLGSWLGARKLAVPALRVLLAAVLGTASIKLLTPK